MKVHNLTAMNIDDNSAIEITCRDKNRKAYKARIALPIETHLLPTLLWQAGLQIVLAMSKERDRNV